MAITACLQLHPVRITVASDWEHRFQMFPKTRNRNKKHRKKKPVTPSNETTLICPEASSPGTRFCQSRALPFSEEEFISLLIQTCKKLYNHALFSREADELQNTTQTKDKSKQLP